MLETTPSLRDPDDVRTRRERVLEVIKTQVLIGTERKFDVRDRVALGRLVHHIESKFQRRKVQRGNEDRFSSSDYYVYYHLRRIELLDDFGVSEKDISTEDRSVFNLAQMNDKDKAFLVVEAYCNHFGFTNNHALASLCRDYIVYLRSKNYNSDLRNRFRKASLGT